MLDYVLIVCVLTDLALCSSESSATLALVQSHTPTAVLTLKLALRCGQQGRGQTGVTRAARAEH